jgi:hypothetical protein
MDSTFTPLYDLFSLTEEQRAAYILALNEHMRLDPRLGLIRLTRMDSDSGARLVPYIGKGGTDILRETWGIDIIDMVQHDGPGYVSFTAVGKNPKGRIDRAVGAASTEGLRGTKLADMVCTAQTKASRRLTLQFVGAGVLDESEVQSTAQMTELPSSGAQLAGSPVVMPPPMAAPSTTPGKDITPEPEKVEPPTPMETLEKLEAQSPKEVGVSSDVENPLNMGMTGAGMMSEPKKRGRPRKKRNTVMIESPGQPTPTVPEVKSFDPKAPSCAAAPVRTVDEPAKCLDCGQPLRDHNFEQGKGYTCKVSPSPEPASAVVLAMEKAQPETVAAPLISDPMKTAIGSAAVIMAPFVKTPELFVTPPATHIPGTIERVEVSREELKKKYPPAPPIPSEKLKEYRERLKAYANDILPKQGGMMPVEGIGGVTMQLRKFTLLQVGAAEVAALTEDQWETLFEFLDEHLKQYGAKELVAYIQKAIGATK